MKLKTQSLLSRSSPDKSGLTAEPIETLDQPVDRSNAISKSGLLNSDEQEKELKIQRPNFIRNNVRSIADPNQLSWTSILGYWKQLLSDDKEQIFILSLFAILTGIRSNRWRNLVVGTDKDITFDNIVYDPKQSCIYYEVLNIATVFELQHEELSPTQLCLKLPRELCELLDKLIQKSVPDGLSDRYQIRKFSNKNPGPSPTLNRIANSGSKLYRLLHMEESESIIISGTIPVEFRVRSCYVSIDLEKLNEKFNNAVIQLFQFLQSNNLLKRNQIVKKALKPLCSVPANTVSSRMIGSQIGHTYTDISFTNFELTVRSSLDVSVRKNQIIKTLNDLEAHFYWMLQYANGNRPSGARSSSIVQGQMRIHADKDSKIYSESKLIFESKMVKEQLSEVHLARQQGYLQLERMGFTVNCSNLTSSRALLHKTHKQSGDCSSVPMHNKAAMVIAESNYDIVFPLNRPNSSRHHVSTYLHTHLSAEHADQSLGHHIEGWDLTAPEASGQSKIVMEEVKNSLESLLKKSGLSIIRSPWS